VAYRELDPPKALKNPGTGIWGYGGVADDPRRRLPCAGWRD
jgi:hypothetical protein